MLFFFCSLDEYLSDCLILLKCLVEFISEANWPWTILHKKDIFMDPLGKEWTP